jgi:hypothetical protein
LNRNFFKHCFFVIIEFLHANTPLSIMFMCNPIASPDPGFPSSARVISHSFQKGNIVFFQSKTLKAPF